MLFTAAYKAAGLEVVDGELPDYLPAVLDLAAADRDDGWRLLRRTGSASTCSRSALDEAGRTAHAVEAVRAMLPAAAARRHRRRRPARPDRAAGRAGRPGTVRARPTPPEDAGEHRAVGRRSRTWPSRSSSAAVIWRYRYDKFGWTTRSSQLYERRCCAGAARCSTSAS